MLKKVKHFLNYLENETSITCDFSTISPTQKIKNHINQPILINVLGINERTFGLAVVRCGCKKCKNIIGVEILYREKFSEEDEARIIQNQIKSAIPSLQVEVRNVSLNE